MENKKILTIGAIVVIGALIVCCIICCANMSKQRGGAMHMMPDGTMMKGGINSMDSMMASMNAGLQGKTGDTFDQEFLAEMIVHHQGAIDMAKLALTNAKHQEVKDLANAIIKAQTSEIAQMKAWQAGWYNQ